ncbi:MAG: Glycerol-3-phosphate acyltransferase [Planctomycetes bacterium ADurb.Bin126]|nr:MAG: Glycerol-3-phosphate acyltransferase [Planctomycetes bacterium ADurb.Bin126]HOD81507.1 glycerol-3-phosphate 1-O-acyltransferase PlsY [Phycisphaerae bacterium]HQL74009.1 glycerol-3-phosphate 1-O-acyltransferase PlsY [Phycisphaerae bacterium]
MIEQAAYLVAFLTGAYLVGSVPFGTIIARAHGVDLRRAGSGNVGATNVGRVLGRKWGYLCFFLDVAKGLLPVLVAGWLLRGLAARQGEGFPTAMHQAAWLSAALGAVLGHVFCPWLKFRGGKGVATALGVVLGVWPFFTYAGLAAFALWIVVTLVSRYVSLGSVVAAVAFIPLFLGVNGLMIGWRRTLGLWPLLIFATAIMLLIVVRHRGNIQRLLAGTENKIGRKKQDVEGQRE